MNCVGEVISFNKRLNIGFVKFHIESEVRILPILFKPTKPVENGDPVVCYLKKNIRNLYSVIKVLSQH